MAETMTVPGTSRFIRTIIVVQTLTITFLGYWLYQEYVNNIYLQVYINNLLRSSSLTVFPVAGSVILASIIIVLYTKLRRARRELDHAIANPDHTNAQSPTSGLDHMTEQHLIEMIRRHPDHSHDSAGRERQTILEETNIQQSPPKERLT